MSIENELCDFIELYNEDSRWDEVVKDLYKYIQKGELKEVNANNEMSVENFIKNGVPKRHFTLEFETLPNKVKYMLFRSGNDGERAAGHHGFVRVGINQRDLVKRRLVS